MKLCQGNVTHVFSFLDCIDTYVTDEIYHVLGGTIRAIMMLIHAYCNIWLEAKAGDYLG